MSATSDTAAVRVINIDTAGDVTLIAQHLELRVSSKLLSTASVVFKTMFQPHFRKGADLAANGTCRIPLPEDDPEVLHQLCAVLKNPNDNDPLYEETPSFLQNFAIMVDKYQCTNTVYRWARRALENQVHHDASIETSRDWLRLLDAAYIMNMPCRFSAITVKMAFSVDARLSERGGGSPDWDIVEDVTTAVPAGLLNAIATHERNLKCLLMESVETLIETVLEKPTVSQGSICRSETARGEDSHDWYHISECDCRRVTCYLQQLKRAGIWPICRAQRTNTLGWLLGRLMTFWMPGIRYDEGAAGKCSTCSIDFSQRIKDIVESFPRRFHGLCLDCFKRNIPGNNFYCCQAT